MLRLAADGGVSREGLFSRDRLLSARAACAHTQTQGATLWIERNNGKKNAPKYSTKCLIGKRRLEIPDGLRDVNDFIRCVFFYYNY